MKAVLKNHFGLALALLGSGSVAAAILVDVLRGQPLILGWPQFLMLLFGGIALLAGLPVMQRWGRAQVDRSRKASADTQALLRRRPGYYLLYSLWFALVVGLGEAAYWAYQKVALDQLLYRLIRLPGPHYVWGIPLGYLLTFGTLGIVLYVLARRWPHRLTVSGVVFVFFFLGFSGWLFLVKGLHDLAATVLAAGIAVQLARLTARHAFLFHTLVRRTLPWLALFMLILAGGLLTRQRLTEQRTMARLPAAASQAPNVLLLVLDTVRAKSLSLYGYARATTPNLDRLAARGTVFERAFSTSPWTLPSHGSMFTGRFPHELTASWMTPVDATHPTLAEVLGGQGYVSAGFVANTTYCNAEFGLDRGFVHYEDHRMSMAKVLWGTSLGNTAIDALSLDEHFGSHESFGRKSAEQVNGDFLGWLAERDEDRPFFVFLNYFDAHHPYYAPTEFSHKFSSRPAAYMDTLTPEEIRDLNDAYDGTIAYLDHHLGLLFDELERRGTLENTVIIVTSDHGEQFDEHGLLGHGNSLYLPLLHVPLFIVYPPAVPAGRRSTAYVSLRDLPATVVDLVDATEAAVFPGNSLAPYWTRPDSMQPPDDMILAEVQKGVLGPGETPIQKGPMKSVIFKEMHYIKNYGDKREELYDLTKNLDEEQDLSDTQDTLVARYRTHLTHILAEGAAQLTVNR